MERDLNRYYSIRLSLITSDECNGNCLIVGAIKRNLTQNFNYVFTCHSNPPLRKLTNVII